MAAAFLGTYLLRAYHKTPDFADIGGEVWRRPRARRSTNGQERNLGGVASSG